jgi:iron complex transport system ATP-binding protein
MPLAAEHISFSYTRARPVLEDVSVTLPAGSVTAIAGPNGAGKSTLLRILLGILRPTTGRVRLDESAIASIPHRLRARRLAYVPQRTSLAFAFTVREYVALGRFAAGAAESPDAIRRAMEWADIADRAADPFPLLSAGQQQRATLARALAQLDTPADRPKVLLADEPASAMDPRHALHTMAILRELAARGHAVAVVLHDLTLAARFCDRAILLNEQGRVAAAGTVGEALFPEILSGVFGVPFERLVTSEGDPVLLPTVVARIGA